MTLTILASSSKANCALVATARTRILVDAGLLKEECFKALAAAGVRPESLTAICVTHHHSDHSCGVQQISMRLRIPVWCSAETAPGLRWNGHSPALRHFEPGIPFEIGDISVLPFEVPHDCPGSCAYSFYADDRKITVAVDLGHIPQHVERQLIGSDVLALEANFSSEMLKVGAYPLALKKRLLSMNGHLSNESVCAFLEDKLDDQTSTVVLAHLSEHTNDAELARMMAERALTGKPATVVLAKDSIGMAL